MLSFSKLLLQKSKPFRSSPPIPALRSNIYSAQYGPIKVASFLIFSIIIGAQLARYGANGLEAYEVYVAQLDTSNDD